MWVRSLVKWKTTNKTNTNAHIGKNCFFQVVHSIKHSNIGCGVYPPHVMTKLKKDENLVGLIWASKVSYAMGLKDVWDNQNWTRSSFIKECEKEVIWLVNYSELEMIHDR
jgi:hypothetical protein